MKAIRVAMTSFFILTFAHADESPGYCESRLIVQPFCFSENTADQHCSLFPETDHKEMVDIMNSSYRSFGYDKKFRSALLAAGDGNAWNLETCPTGEVGSLFSQTPETPLFEAATQAFVKCGVGLNILDNTKALDRQRCYNKELFQ